MNGVINLVEPTVFDLSGRGLNVGDRGVAPIMMSIEHIRRQFQGSHETNVVIEDVNLTVRKGEFVTLVGPSGCGKTTLLLCLAGLMPLSGGRIQFRGETVLSPPAGLSVVFQDYSRSLFPWKRNRDNVLFGMRRLKNLSKSEKYDIASDLLAAVGLADFANHYPWQVSGGMQQRVAIARALAARSEVLLLDEPFASLDAQTRADMHELVLDLFKKYDQTCILVTHDIEEAIYLSTRLCVLSHRPSRIELDIPVDLPVPRDPLLSKEHPRFLELRHQVLEMIKRAPENRQVRPELTPQAVLTQIEQGAK
jgi:NitT/TauT family transport system ATP-binding protein